MSWLISLLIAGTMFSSENFFTRQPASNHSEKTSVAKIYKADESERFEQTYPLSATGRVGVSNVNGSIIVEGWDRNEVKLEYVKTADTREHLADVQVKIDQQNDSLNVEAKYNFEWNRNNGGNWKNKNSKVEVEFRLMVPRNAVLNEIETVNGSINVSNTTNSVKVSAVNGEVRALNLRGAAELSTVNGTVTADFDRLENTTRISLETVNGQAFLTVPSDINATVRAENVNGQITNDFGLPVRKGQYVGRTLYGKIGNGDVKIKLNSVNGELSLKRKQDGKNPNPVTNLLQSKSAADDEDFDADATSEAGKVKINVPKIKVDIQKAMEQAQKEIANANLQINSEEMQRTIREAARVQKEAMARMRETDWSGAGVSSVQRKSESFAVKGIPKIKIDAKNCAVSVRGWDKPEVKYTVTQISSENNSALEPKIEHSDSEVNIKIAENDSSSNDFEDGARLRIEVYVPRKSNLQIISRHQVRLENVSGEIDIEGGEEAVDIRDSEGNLNVSATDGKVRVIGFRGAVDAKTKDGLIGLEGNFEKLSARTSNGTIVLTLPENTNATIESNRRDIVAEDISLVYQGDEKSVSTWKIGSGGSGNYRLYSAAGGKIFVRNLNSVKSN